MEETMNNGVEVLEMADENREIEVKEEKTMKPSKGFVTLVVGGIAAAAAVGAVLAIRKHKKKTFELEDIVETPNGERFEESEKNPDEDEK